MSLNKDDEEWSEIEKAGVKGLKDFLTRAVLDMNKRRRYLTKVCGAMSLWFFLLVTHSVCTYWSTPLIFAPFFPFIYSKSMTSKTSVRQGFSLVSAYAILH